MFIFSNLAITLDGKIATPSRIFYALGTPKDRAHMQVLRAHSDVVLFGAGSLRVFRKPCTVSGPLKSSIVQQPANAVLSSELEGISPSWPFFKGSKFHRILFISARAKAAKAKPFERSCEIISLKKPSARLTTARQVIRELEHRGYRKTLVEGGGGVMWDFARENLIDEYHVTLTPKIIGGVSSPTLVDGEGFEPADVLNLKLASCAQAGDELYLVYRKTNRRG